jgi:putative transcriptional regulator
MKRKRGARVAQARQHSGFSQQALADKLGVGRQSIARIEAGKQVPSVDVAMAIATAVGQPIDELFGGGR